MEPRANHPIQLYTFGTLRVVRDGYTVAESDWQTRQARQLLKILITERPRPVSTDRLIDLLVRRSLAGDTTFLREHETAEALGLGRTALRSILAALSGEGLVIHEPRRGWRARALTQADFDAFTQVREALELLALDLAFTRIDPAMITRFEQGNAASATGTDNDLHRYLIDLAQNPYLTDFFARHGTYFELVFRWEGQDPQAAAEARQQHLAILTAIRGKNQSAARRALTAHIRGQHPVIADLMRKTSPRSPDT